MTEELIVIESGYKMASNNHKIQTLGPFNASKAEEKYQELLSGTSTELPAAKNTTVVAVSERQFLRVRNGLSGATILDRVTRGTVV